MNRLLRAAVYGAIVAVALAWRFGPLLASALAPVGASLFTLLVAATTENKGEAHPARRDINALTTVDRT